MFETHLAATTYIAPGGWALSPPAGAHLTLRFDRAAETAELSGLPNPIPSGQVNDHLTMLSIASEVIAVQRELAQLARNHPADHGLVPAGIPSRQAHLRFSPVLSSAAYATVDRDLAVPASETTDASGWFSPDADPQEFGTLFAYPRHPAHSHADAIIWQVGQVGVGDSPLASAHSRDTEACQNVFRMVAENDYEPHLVGVALSNDPETFRQMRQLTVKRRRTLEAKNLFSSRRLQVKPQLTTRLAWTVCENMPSRWRQLSSDRGLFPRTNVYSLNRNDLGVRAKPVHIAATVTFNRFSRPGQAAPHPHPHATPAEFFDEYATKLRDELDQRGLGRLYRITGLTHPAFLITHDLDKLTRVWGLLGMPTATGVEELTAAGWGVVHDLTAAA